MISELFISNLAIIEETRIEFKSGLNIITGETGSGKSVVIEALELLLGARANKDLVGIYSDKAIVEGVVSVNKSLIDLIESEYGIQIEDENIIITREIYKDGKSIVRLNNRQVKLSIIKYIMGLTINIHAQNDNQLLLNQNNYIDIIDFVSDEELNKLKLELNSFFKKKNLINKDIEKLSIDSTELERRIDILDYQINEINDLQLDKLDIDELEKEHKLLNNSLEISSNINSIKEIFSSSDYNSKDISLLISKSISLIEDIKEFDDKLKNLCETLKNIDFMIQDFKYEIIDYHDSIITDDKRLHDLDLFFNSLDSLKRKYGNSIDDIIKFKENAEIELNEYKKKDEKLSVLKIDLENINKKINNMAKSISKIRVNTAKRIQEQIKKELIKLNFVNNEFLIKIYNKDKADKNGIDIVDFLASFNLGQEMKSLSEIASGGELSRFMLALKIVIAEHDKINTLIFDEIDSGISGITAQVVGEVIKKLSKNYQIILVTHLPQIAVLGNHHILIKKYEDNNITKTKLVPIIDDELVHEIARLLGGSNISESVIMSAREQLSRKPDNQ